MESICEVTQAIEHTLETLLRVRDQGQVISIQKQVQHGSLRQWHTILCASTDQEGFKPVYEQAEEEGRERVTLLDASISEEGITSGRADTHTHTHMSIHALQRR